MPQISVIVPVYKAEKYISSCIKSIMEQTYGDFELILVNDGSPDNSGAICEEYAKQDERIYVIHQKNQGASAARNAGLDIAQGVYVAFCDSDDIVAPRWLEHLYAYASHGTLPMCSHCKDHSTLGCEMPISAIGTELHPTSAYYLFNQYGIAGYLWNALYKNKIVQSRQLRFRVQHELGDYNEDLIFALQYLRSVSHVVYTGYADYLYNTHEGSLSRSSYEHYFAKYEEKYILWRQFLNEYDQEEYKKLLATTMLYHVARALNYADCSEVKRIVSSSTVQEIVCLADTSAENPQVIHLIQKKAARLLWLRLHIHNLKGRLL